MVKKRLSDLLREEVNKSDATPDENQAADPPAKSAESSAQPDAKTADTPSLGKPQDKPQNGTASPKSNARKAAPKAEPAKPTPEPIAPPAPGKALGEPLRLGVHPSQNIPQGTSSQDSQNSQDSQETVVETASANGTAKRTSSAKADKADKTELEGTIAQLKTELTAAQKQSQQQETQFAEQLDRLQTEMKRQQSVIDQLQTEIQHSKSLKAELEEARQVILKLSEINSKPIDAKYASSDGSKDGSKDISKPANPATSQTTPPASQPRTSQTNGAAPPASGHHLYVKAGESKPIEPPSARPATSRFGAPLVPAPTNAAEPELESKPVQLKMPGANPDAGKLAPPARHQQELRRILDHPTRPGALPPMPTPSSEDKKDDKKLSETDMGWVD